VTARVSIIIPALNEADAIANVVRGFLQPDLGTYIAECIVVDNGSTDATANNARNAEARVISEPRLGYGQACATGAAAALPSSDVFVFVDGDGSDIPEELPLLAGPVMRGEYDFVIGSRTRGQREQGSLLASQRFAGWLAGRLLRLRYGIHYTDMGPFRAITRQAFEALRMSEMTYGWNLEMQMKAARAGMRVLEIPVNYRNRQGGVSKVAGSIQGSIKAAQRIAQVLLRIGLAR
jgi:glycosyltransferase involved in cell wall biosynthesis